MKKGIIGLGAFFALVTMSIAGPKVNGVSRMSSHTDILPENPTTYSLGSVKKPWRRVVAKDFVMTSDSRLKKDIKAMKYGLDQVMKLEPVEYRWKSDSDKSEKKLGLIAQDVQKVMKELVSEDGDLNQTKGVKYVDLVPVLIKAIQEQQLQIATLTQQVAKLKEQTSDKKSVAKVQEHKVVYQDLDEG